MPGSCNQLLLFTDRKGNHKSSEWHWGLESSAPFPTKQVVSTRELAIVFTLEKKKKYIFLAARPPQAAELGGGRHRGSGRGTFLLYPPPREPLTPQPEALPENCVCRHRAARPSVPTSRFFSCFPSETGF